MDKVYQQKNLELAWEKVKRNKGSAGIDGQSVDEFESNREENLKRLHDELKAQTYKPQPVKQHLIPKGDNQGNNVSLEYQLLKIGWWREH